MGKMWKKLIVISAITLAILGGFFTYQKYSGANTQIVEADTNEVKMENSALKNRILTLLGKNSGDKLYIDDFMNHDDYKPVLDTQTNQMTANIQYLNLDNTDTHNILELAQFIWPETLVGISLAGNNITNADLNRFVAFAQMTENLQYDYNGKTLTCRSNIDQIIRKINLSFNNIDLKSTSSGILNRNNSLSKPLFLFGIQNIPSDAVVTEDVAANILHYIREDDSHYLSYNISFHDYRTLETTQGYKTIESNSNKAVRVIPKSTNQNMSYGTYTINVSALTNSDTNYFANYNYTIGSATCALKYVSVAFVSDFYIERGNPFVIPYSLENLNNWASTENKVIIQGFDNITSFSYTDASTRNVTKDNSEDNMTIITITGDGMTKQFPLAFVVKDTIAPKIELRGKATMYISRGKTFVDPGVRAYDPISPTDTDGDNLNGMVKMYDADTGNPIGTLNGGINTGTLGTKRIKYEVSDSGNPPNKSTAVIRTVVILESVLDTLNIRITESKLTTNTEIEVIAEPSDGTPVNNYKDYKYVWYLDDVKFNTTYPIDNVSKKTSTTIIFNNTGNHELRVVLTAKQVSDNTEVEIESKQTLEVVAGLSENQELLIALAIAVVLIIIAITIISYIRYRKAKKKTHHKKSSKAKKIIKQNDHDKSKPDTGEITVIKDYKNGGTTGSGNKNGSGGGNENNRLPETENQQGKE